MIRRRSDLSIEVAKAKAAKADLHMVVTRLNDAILMVREMVKQKYEPMGIISPGSPGMYQTQFLKALGKYAELLPSPTCRGSIPSRQFAHDLRDGIREGLSRTRSAISMSASASRAS